MGFENPARVGNRKPSRRKLTKLKVKASAEAIAATATATVSTVMEKEQLSSDKFGQKVKEEALVAAATSTTSAVETVLKVKTTATAPTTSVVATIIGRKNVLEVEVRQTTRKYHHCPQ